MDRPRGRGRNRQDYSGYGRVPDGPNALSLHPADDPTFTVTGTPATRPPAKRAGTLRTLRFSNYHVDTTATRRRVRIGARFAGASPRHVSVQLDSARKSRHTHPVYLRAQLRRHGHNWSRSVLVPRWLGDQRLQVSLYADWGASYRPYSRYYDTRQLHRAHRANTLVVVSGVDDTAPLLGAVTLTPSPIDSTAGAEVVTVTAAATDASSGVRSVTVSGDIRHGRNGVDGGSYPYAAAGIGYLSSQDFYVRLHKDAQGDWVGTTTVQQCVPTGTYLLTARAQDYANNYRYYSTKQLARAHITSATRRRRPLPPSPARTGRRRSTAPAAPDSRPRRSCRFPVSGPASSTRSIRI